MIIPGDLRYLPVDRSWTAAHTGYSEVVRDGTYHETSDEWTGSHASYEDRYEPTAVESEPEIPDFRTMWAAAHPQSLDDAVVTGSVSGGSLHLTLQRDSTPGEHAVPMATTAVQVSVLGTDLSMAQVFSDVSPTLDVSLDGVPAGIHTVEVKAYADGRVVGVTTFTVRVADEPQPSPDAPTPATPAADQAQADSAPAAPLPVAWDVAPGPPARRLPGEQAETPLANPGPPSWRPAPVAVGPEVVGAPPPALPPDLEILNPAEDSYIPGQAMASAEGIVARPAWAADEGRGGVSALLQALEAETDDRGGRRPRS